MSFVKVILKVDEPTRWRAEHRVQDALKKLKGLKTLNVAASERNIWKNG